MQCPMAQNINKGETLSLQFQKITLDNIDKVWSICRQEEGRTTDFSFGGLLMWSDIFDYEYAIVDDTLFIKGRNEDDMESVAFSFPIGKLPLKRRLDLLSEWCEKHETPLILSAVPDYALEELKKYEPKVIKELQGWADYLYDIEKLAMLSGKKMSKKRNHVHQYIHHYGEPCYERISSDNLSSVVEFMQRLEKSPAPSSNAALERRLASNLLQHWDKTKNNYFGGLLKIDGQVVAFTVGDIKGDTLFIHVEKADRDIIGSYEMINKAFAEDMWNAFPHLKFVNREDDSDDEGLRKAKMSYHPVGLLTKYTLIF